MFIIVFGSFEMVLLIVCHIHVSFFLSLVSALTIAGFLLEKVILTKVLFASSEAAHLPFTFGLSHFITIFTVANGFEQCGIA